ncbi:MAG: hypothetical protein R2712_06895 [Vicinamibacterales bacterium]
MVVKIPRWNFEKFPQADRTLTTQMKSVGEAMSIGRTFKEAFLKGIRSLELGKEGLLFRRADARDDREGQQEDEEATLRRDLVVPTDRRMWALFRALDKGWTVERLHELTHGPLVPRSVRGAGRTAADGGDDRAARHVTRPAARAEARGFSDQELAEILGADATAIRERRHELGLIGLQAHRHLRRRVRVVHAVCTQLRGGLRGGAHRPRRIIILGSGPNRIGQGIEFDYCCCHAVFGFRKESFETIMVNCNGDRVHRLRHGRPA